MTTLEAPSTQAIEDGASPVPGSKKINPKTEAPANSDKDEIVRAPGSSLAMTRGALSILVNHVCDLIVNTKKANEEWYRKRDHYVAEHQNDFRHRERPGEIFEKSNLSFNQSKRNAVPIIARAVRDFLGVEPFFSCDPVQQEGDDTEVADIEGYLQFKMRQANLAEALKDSVVMGVVVNERVVKITHVRDVTFYKESATVLVDSTGQPVRTTDGSVIYDDDEWVMPGELANPDLGTLRTLLAKLLPNMPQVFQALMRLVMPSVAAPVLKKDPSIQQPAGFSPEMFKQLTVDQIYVRRSGPDVKGIHHRDFIIPNWCRDIQTAPFCAHQFSMTAPEMTQQYVTPVDETQLDAEEKAFFADVLAGIKQFQGDTAEPKDGAGKPDHAHGEVWNGSIDELNPQGLLAEAYLSYDVDGDGKMEEIMLTVAADKRFALALDFTPNVVPPKIGRPFRRVTPDPAPNRWYGQGEYENGAHKQETIDWMANRLIWENSISGMYRWFNPKAFLGTDEEPPVAGENFLEVKDPETFDPAKAIGYIALPPLSDTTMDFMKSFMQSSQAERGNLSPGGDSLSQLPSSKLKYGIQAIQQAGDEIYAYSVINLREGLTEVLRAAAIMALANMDPVEEYQLTQGDQTLTRTMTREAIEDLDFNVRFEMTLTRGDQINEENAAAIEMVQAYAALPAFQQEIVRPLFLNRLKTIDIQDPEKYLPAPDPAMVQQSKIAAMQAMMPQPPQAPAASVPAKPSQVAPDPGAPPQPKVI